MDLFLNFGLAWVSVFLTVFLSIIYFLRILSRRPGKFKDNLNKLNKSLRKNHKLIGIVLVVTGLVHGLFSSESVFSLNLGTVAWIISILLGLNWLLRKYFARMKGWMHYHRALTMVFVLVIVWHVIDVGGIQVQKVLFDAPQQVVYGGSESSDINLAASDSEASENSFDGAVLKDGVYTGEATGYRPGLQVSVEVKNGAVTSIQVTDHNEVNARFYSVPVQVVPQEIEESQSLDVELISGATFTSVGIINAVKDALSNALVSGELPDDLALPQNRGRRH